MKTTELYDLALDRIIQLTDQYCILQNQGDEVRAAIVRYELDCFVKDMDSDDDVFFVNYHRNISPSNGEVFDESHEDPETKFGNLGFTR